LTAEVPTNLLEERPTLSWLNAAVGSFGLALMQLLPTLGARLAGARGWQGVNLAGQAIRDGVVTAFIRSSIGSGHHCRPQKQGSIDRSLRSQNLKMVCRIGQRLRR